VVAVVEIEVVKVVRVGWEVVIAFEVVKIPFLESDY
jgi:hypothetical protein